MDDLGENLLRFQKDQLYLVIDGESESLNLLGGNRAWEWAYQIYKGTKLLESHDEFVWYEDLELSSGAQIVTGFNYEEYKSKARAPKDILEKFDTYLYDEKYKIVGANFGGFDCYLHNQWRCSLGKKSDYSYFNRILDIQCIEKAIELGINIPKDKDGYLSFLFKMYGFRRRGLKTNVAHLLKKYQIPHEDDKLHDALYDIRKEKEIFDQQIYKIDI